MRMLKGSAPILNRGRWVVSLVTLLTRGYGVEGLMAIGPYSLSCIGYTS